MGWWCTADAQLRSDAWHGRKPFHELRGDLCRFGTAFDVDFGAGREFERTGRLEGFARRGDHRE